MLSCFELVAMLECCTRAPESLASEPYNRGVVTATQRVKPRLRGVFHEVGFFVGIGVGIPLVLTADEGRARLSAVVFALCVVICFGASALYHRPTWQPNVRGWLARVDHAGLYLLIAGTYTPFGLLVLSTGWAIPVLSIVWV